MNFALPDEILFAHDEKNRCQPVIEKAGIGRVISWGAPEDVHPGDFVFTIFHAAFQLNASEILFSPLREFDEVRVHFRIGSVFVSQPTLTPIQFGYVAILLSHISSRPNGGQNARRFRAPNGIFYEIHFRKIKQGERSSAISITFDKIAPA